MSDELKLQIQNLVRIGTALSSERNIDVLLEMIVEESRRFTGADGGTLYVISDDGSYLDWKILQNQTMGTRMGGTSGIPIHLPPVPLTFEGQPNTNNVCAACVNTGNPINILDAYEADGYDFVLLIDDVVIAAGSDPDGPRSGRFGLCDCGLNDSDPVYFDNVKIAEDPDGTR